MRNETTKRIAGALLPTAALVAAACGVLLTGPARGYFLLGFGLPVGQRDFRVFNNFSSQNANGNQTPDANFPGYQGALMAVWKGCVEWQSRLHGNGDGDPHQPGGIGSGGANFDPSFQGDAVEIGGLNDNTHSQISGCNGGVLAFCEGPGENGWRIRYYECWEWDDGPGASAQSWDLQGISAHEYGHALGLGHSGFPAATMWPSIGSGSVSERSIHEDDIAGVQAAYGVHSATKPIISAVTVSGSQLTIDGSGFHASDARVWFTQAPAGGDGSPIKASAGPTNGTQITIDAPLNAGPGDVLVINPGWSHDVVSNSWPVDVLGPQCPPPASYCVTSPNSAGGGMGIGHQGSTSVATQSLALTAHSGPPLQPGIFYYGPEQIVLPFGDGVRCVGAGSLGTFRLPVVVLGPLGAVVHPLDWNAPPISAGPGAIGSGDEWNFQFWYRDPGGGPAGFNFSDALEIQFCP
ncbi:MAG: hypothetical protein CMJ84_17400 [Planctomycetes bacterium]|jgi:hypothetical protein|nr:hypothetical protein [Planctomycetota bacterium]MDP6410872.1 matrixin family metalloprotease [Planctomycetota bacterium]